jgi:hypothetical protein
VGKEGHASRLGSERRAAAKKGRRVSTGQEVPKTADLPPPPHIHTLFLLAPVFSHPHPQPPAAPSHHHHPPAPGQPCRLLLRLLVMCWRPLLCCAAAAGGQSAPAAAPVHLGPPPAHRGGTCQQQQKQDTSAAVWRQMCSEQAHLQQHQPWAACTSWPQRQCQRQQQAETSVGSWGHVSSSVTRRHPDHGHQTHTDPPRPFLPRATCFSMYIL